LGTGTWDFGYGEDSEPEPLDEDGFDPSSIPNNHVGIDETEFWHSFQFAEGENYLTNRIVERDLNTYD